MSLLASLSAGPASAQEARAATGPGTEQVDERIDKRVDKRIEWKPHWHRANLWDGALIVAGFGLYAADAHLIPHPNGPGWTGPILFDEPLRDVLRARGRAARTTAETVADVLQTGSLVHNLVFDNLIVALALHREPEVAFQMSVASAQAYAVTFALTTLVKSVTARDRPSIMMCEQDPDYSDDCSHYPGPRSFFSGHSSTTATGAGLLCAHHTHLPLYDNRVLDLGACAVGIAFTTITGLLRVSADRHWASDVITGHMVGFASGYFLPSLLFYTDPVAGDDTALLPHVARDQLGLRLIGRLQ